MIMAEYSYLPVWYHVFDFATYLIWFILIFRINRTYSLLAKFKYLSFIYDKSQCGLVHSKRSYTRFEEALDINNAWVYVCWKAKLASEDQIVQMRFIITPMVDADYDEHDSDYSFIWI